MIRMWEFHINNAIISGIFVEVIYQVFIKLVSYKFIHDRLVSNIPPNRLQITHLLSIQSLGHHEQPIT